MEIVKIGNENFKVCKPIVASAVLEPSFKALSLCYEKPSIAKQEIYGYWCDWAMENNFDECGVVSYNSMMFTFGAVGRYHGKLCYVYITKTRQEFRYIV